MKWGIWHVSVSTHSRPFAVCDADTYEEARKKLLPQSPITESEVKIEPMTTPGKAHDTRYYLKTGPVLTEKDLRKQWQ